MQPVQPATAPSASRPRPQPAVLQPSLPPEGLPPTRRTSLRNHRRPAPPAAPGPPARPRNAPPPGPKFETTAGPNHLTTRKRPFGAVLRGPHGIPASGQSSSTNGCEPLTSTGPWLGSKVLPLDIGRRAYCSASRLRENGMEASEVRRPVEAGGSTASALGLQVDDVVVIHNSDRIALRLIPCDVLARVAPSAHRTGSEFEVEVARRLTETDGPVAELEPRAEYRAYLRDGFAISLWTYYEPAGSEIAPAEYAGALMRLHAARRPRPIWGAALHRSSRRREERGWRPRADSSAARSRPGTPQQHAQ